MLLLDYLLGFKIKENFFRYTPHEWIKDKRMGDYESKIGFYHDELGFISCNIMSKIFLGKKFLSFKEVFPSNKKFLISMPSLHYVRKEDPIIEPFYFKGSSFVKAIDSRKKALVDLERLYKKYEEYNEKEHRKILKKYNLIETNHDPEIRYFSNNHLYEAFFEHNYTNNKIPKIYGSGPVTNDNFFLVKKGSGKMSYIFYVDTGNLMYVKKFEIEER